MAMQITFGDGDRVDALYRGKTISTDQEGPLPQPFELFLASIGTCTGYYVAKFCHKRDIPTDGIRLEMSNNNTLFNNTVAWNNAGGIYSKGSYNNSLLNNTCDWNWYDGIVVENGTDHLVEFNYCQNNGNPPMFMGSGIIAVNSSFVDIRSNVCQNDQAGIRLHYSDNCTVVSNFVRSGLGIGDGYGIRLVMSPDNTIDGNQADSNTMDGLRVQSSDDKPTHSKIASPMIGLEWEVSPADDDASRKGWIEILGT